jgi:putative ATPase subunit gpP of terminase
MKSTEPKTTFLGQAPNQSQFNTMEKQISRRNKRYKAKRLYLTKKYTSREICKKVGITEKTMSIWIYTYGWNSPERDGLIPKTAVFGFKHKGFYDYLKNSNPKLIECLKIELKGFIDINKGIIARQKSQLNMLIKPIGLDKNEQCQLFSEITGRPIEDISQLKYKEAANLIEYVGQEDNLLELIIKKANT